MERGDHVHEHVHTHGGHDHHHDNGDHVHKHVHIHDRSLIHAPAYHVYGGGELTDLTIPIAEDIDYAEALLKRHDHDHKHVSDHHHRRSAVSLDVPGTIDIKTIFSSADVQIKLASLVLGVDPSTNASFVMSATNKTATPVYLHVNPNTTAPSDASGNPVKVVSLRIPVFDRTQATETDYCAQFDPNPLPRVGRGRIRRVGRVVDSTGVIGIR